MNGSFLFNLNYSQVEVAADRRRRPVKLWSSTANGPQRTRCGEIGSPEREKMPMIIDYLIHYNIRILS
jgi:hypothetical protein